MLTDKQALRLAYFLRGFNRVVNVRKRVIIDEGTGTGVTLFTVQLHGTTAYVAGDIEKLMKFSREQCYDEGGRVGQKVRDKLETRPGPGRPVDEKPVELKG